MMVVIIQHTQGREQMATQRKLDELLRARLIEQGAIACLIKPFSDDAMVDALNSALQAKLG